MRTALLVGILAGLTVVLVYRSLPDYRDAPETYRAQAGKAVVDRNGRILRLVPNSEGQFCLWCDIDRFPGCLKQAIMASEDKRFPYHPGFDPIAVVRAVISNIRAGETISGASTITQQVVRLIKPRPRTYSAKFMELLEGIKMECQLSKDQIMELYLNMSPMGGNVRGVGLAARMYFNKSVEDITVSEAAFLTVMPRSPSRFDPRRESGRREAMPLKDQVLELMTANGCLERSACSRKLGCPVEFDFQSLPMEAPHLVDLALRKNHAEEPVCRTTIDLDIQQFVERVLASHRERLKKLGITQAGVVVSWLPSSEVLAMVGSLEYSAKNNGFNNAVIANRSAGSTLKPFLYARAFDGGLQPSSRLADTFRSYTTPHGDYLPYNSDRLFYGPVSMRTALGNSLNISAVKLLNDIGPSDFHEVLQRLDVLTEDAEPADYYGLGLAVGNVEVSLFRLVQAYGCLAWEGHYRPLRYLKRGVPTGYRVFSEGAAFLTADILSDPGARLLTFGNPDALDFGFTAALKTGTSTGYRDCWIVAYTPSYVVGVWAGNFDGRPTRGATGAKACGPIAKDIFKALKKAGRAPVFRKPDSIITDSICWMSGKKATASCPYTVREYVMSGSDRLEVCDMDHGPTDLVKLGTPYARWLDRRSRRGEEGRYRLDEPAQRDRVHRRAGARGPRISIVSPHHGDRFLRQSHAPTHIRFQALVDPLVEHVTWLIDGEEAAKTEPPFEWFWKASKGRHTVHAVTPTSLADRIVIHVE